MVNSQLNHGCTTFISLENEKYCQNRRYPNQSRVVYIFHKGIISFILCGYEVQMNVYFFILSESPPLIPLHLEPPLLSSLKHVIDNVRGLSERDLSGSWFNITQNSFTLTPPSNQLHVSQGWFSVKLHSELFYFNPSIKLVTCQLGVNVKEFYLVLSSTLLTTLLLSPIHCTS